MAAIPTRIFAVYIILTVAVYGYSYGAEPGPSLTVHADQPGNKISPTLWGIFFEDINLSADGGIYPEFVRNRSFEDSDMPENWILTKKDGDKSEMAIDTGAPLNPMNRRSLRMNIDGSADLVNEGYWGMNVIKGDHYQVRLAARAADGFTGPIGVLLRTKTTGRVLAKGEITGLTDQWKWFTLDFTASDTDPKAQLCLYMSGKGTLWLDMVSVMPKKTWKDHGLRSDLCEMLKDLKPSFVRFPGGCWVEGDDMAHMNHWKNTIGDIAHRQPLWNIWQYWATRGLGYHEYLQLCEDLGAEPLFCINVGMSHREVIPMDQMGQWVQDALDAIEYANGPANSVWGGLRAKNGHPAPFNMKYIEIGNENGGSPYQERYALFYDAIKARYPNMILIADEPSQQRPADIVDEHFYNNPEFFMRQADHFDKYDRKGPKIFVGEYAVTSGTGLGNMRGAIGEAAFMTGLERNADVVVMASYAPLFVNLNHKRWPINLINFDSSRVFGLPSYYVQKMFSENRGDVILPVEVSGADFMEDELTGGAIGVGTWATQAEFKDIKVTQGDKTLFADDFSKGTSDWRLLNGEWKAEQGVLRQNSLAQRVQAIAGDKTWTDYTFSLKARKLGGVEGFLIPFHVQDDNRTSWWNIGGWGNARHAIEMDGIVCEGVPGQVEIGRWYDIRIELKGRNIKCYLDGKLIHDVTPSKIKTLYASASRAQAGGEIILKVVNVGAKDARVDINVKNAGPLNPEGAATILSANADDENSLDEPRKVSPASLPINNVGEHFNYAFKPWSLTIIRIAAAKN
jgi:alpha-L-arabinofuranosidase